MGPHFFKCGKQSVGSARGVAFAMASMGPHFFKCGKFINKYGYSGWRGKLQWGRTFSSAESIGLFSGGGFGRVSFNGAALFQVRKVPEWEQVEGEKGELQWGRTFSSAESSTLISDTKIIGKGFNGAALFQVRKASAYLSAAVSAESASMGPHFFKCGKSVNNPTFDRPVTVTLQWGRTFSSAESTPARNLKPLLVSASMGPHFFKCGKGDSLESAGNGAISFNGAALFQVRKGRPVSASITYPVTLQWGRTFSSAESNIAPHGENIAEQASMGPHFFKCGKR